jgi:2-C-methyl-D-erythritol 4-phosphate cytidylyltransferase/2-C-methyl-D-erythritol 2,4-cyclodiphosphate synthase
MHEKYKNIGVIIVAAGNGVRAGGDKPKQYQNIAAVPVLRRTIDAFLPYFPMENLRIVISEEHKSFFQECIQGPSSQDLQSHGPQSQDFLSQSSQGHSLSPPVLGGRTRQESVFNGLQAFGENPPDYILVHDAARPFVTADIITSVIKALENGSKAVVPAVKIVDTLKFAENDIISHTVPRDNLYKVQTPQGFDFKALLNSHSAEVGKEHTDDGAVMEATGHSITLSKGDEDNFKITVADDFKKAEKMIMNSLNDIRVGSGFDVHRFETGDKVTLCGVDIPFNQKLKGHSDADVAMHALTDAILSAIAAGDIGTHFPPSDIRWKGEPSETFLKHAANLVQEQGGIIAHAGITIICEAPKIGPHKDTMRKRLANIMNMDMDRISVQATTTEKLGFTGRGEGIAAQATATIRLP